MNNFDSYGRANLASKLRELKSSKPGVHYNDENSYQRKIMDDFFNIDVTSWKDIQINENTNYIKKAEYNYIYFYLKEGKGEINGILVIPQVLSYIPQKKKI